MSPETHDPELASLAQALSGLAPSAGRLDRDQVLFRAGKASAGQQSQFWRTTAAAMGLLAVAVGVSPFLRPTPQRVQCIIYQRVEPPTSAAEVLAVKQLAPQDGTAPAALEAARQAEMLSYSRLQRVVFTNGVDALPNPPAAFGARQRDPLLNRPTDVLAWNRWLRMQTP